MKTVQKIHYSLFISAVRTRCGPNKVGYVPKCKGKKIFGLLSRDHSHHLWVSVPRRRILLWLSLPKPFQMQDRVSLANICDRKTCSTRFLNIVNPDCFLRTYIEAASTDWCDYDTMLFEKTTDILGFKMPVFFQFIPNKNQSIIYCY